MSDPEDLEDGEIEDDEDDVQPVDPPLIQPTPADSLEYEPKPNEQQDSGGENHKSGTTGNNREQSNHSNKSQRSSKKPAPVVDDWATKVEHAIANALIKDGVQPPMPSSVGHGNDADRTDDTTTPVSSGRRSKKRKKASRGGEGQHMSKQQRLGEPEDESEMDLEYEMLNVRGSSPQAILGGRDSVHTDSEGEDTHYSSDDSSMRDRDGHFRGNRRDREHRERERERERDREREREREFNRKKRKQSRQRANNKSNRDGRKRKRDDSDDEKHRPTGPRKMELCKFYLMDCCAKREKCLYMHKDFPCKYYYLGMKCKEKDKCLFSHGEPLKDDLRAILLKHLETAPQEILGDFQRIGRDVAISMLNATHRKLQERYGGKADSAGGGKIPSLLDVVTVQPPNNIHGSKQQHASRKSRWCERPDDDHDDRGSDGDEPSLGEGEGDMMEQLAGVITPAQIADLEQMGIRTLDEISQLTVAQLNELGLSITQIHDLQVRALNALKQAKNVGTERRHPVAKDQDMRSLPGAERGTDGGNKKDVDMRIMNPPPERADSTALNNDEEMGPLGNLPLKPPTVDYSQYIKDSNLDEDDLDAVATADTSCLLDDQQDEEDDDDDDENHLKISIEEEEDDDRKETPGNATEPPLEKGGDSDAHMETEKPLPPLVPPKIDYAKGLGDILMFGSTTPIDKSLDDAKSPHRSPSPTAKDELSAKAFASLADVWTPSMADTTTGGSSYSAPQSKPTPKESTKKTPSVSKRTGGSSIYDWYDSDNASSPDRGELGSPSSASFRYNSERLLPLDIGDGDLYGTGNIGGSGGGGGEASTELGFPFKPMMANYVPATEIDGSIGSHAPIQYKVYVVDVSRPNFGTIRRSMTRPLGSKDPRLRRLFALQSDDDHDADDGSDGIKSPDPNPGASPLYSSHPPTMPSVVPVPSKPVISSGPRVDPRKRHAETQRMEAQQQQPGGSYGASKAPGTASTMASGNSTPQIDVQAILQKSGWYKELGSKHKIMVNQQLAILSSEMKKYHNSDRSPEQLSEFMKFLGTNNMLQHILTCLNVFVDDSVTFCEVPVVPNLPPPSFPILPNIPPPSMGGGPLPTMAMPLHVPPPIGVMPGSMSLPPPLQPNVPHMFLGPKGPFGPHEQPPHQQQPGGPGGPPSPSSGMMRPGLLGVSPNMPFEQFLAMGNINKNDGPGGSGNNNGPLPPWVQGNGNNMRNMRNNNRIGHNFRNNNDRWNNNGGGSPMGGGNNGNNGGGGQGNNIRRNNNSNNRRMDRKK